MRVLLMLKSKLFAAGLASILRKEGVTVINGEKTEKNGDPDLIVTDFGSLSLIPQSRVGRSKVLLLDTGLRKEELISAILSHKLSGIINPRTNSELFKKALKVVKNGQIWIENEILKIFIREPEEARKVIEVNFSELERKMIEYVCKGLTNREIAENLGISEKTVKTYLTRIFRKLGISTRIQLLSIMGPARRFSKAS